MLEEKDESEFDEEFKTYRPPYAQRLLDLKRTIIMFPLPVLKTYAVENEFPLIRLQSTSKIELLSWILERCDWNRIMFDLKSIEETFQEEEESEEPFEETSNQNGFYIQENQTILSRH